MYTEVTIKDSPNPDADELNGADNGYDNPEMLRSALSYHKRGWKIHALPAGRKKPGRKNWQNGGFTDEDVVKQVFSDYPYNIGLLTGARSGNTHDFDLDHSVAALVATILIPNTFTFGRPGKPMSHRLIITADGSLKTRRRVFAGVGTLVELRGDGGQTVLPPSTHASGEQLRIEHDTEIVTMTCAEAESLLNKIAAATLLAIHWPDGTRNDASGALAGWLSHSGWSPEDIRAFVESVVTGAQDEEASDRLRFADATIEAFSRGEPVTGYPPLLDCVGEKILKRMARWLNTGNDGKKSAPDLDQTGYGNAKHFAELYGDQVRYVALDKAWYIYNGKVWQPDEVNQVAELAYQSILHRGERALTLPRSGQKDEMEWVQASLGVYRLRELLEIASSFPEIRAHPTEFDNDLNLVATQKCVVNLETGDESDFHPDYMQTKMMGGRYLPEVSGVASDRYLKSTFESTEDLIPWLQRVAGHTLTAELTEEVLPILYGPGGSGKSTFIDALGNAFGDYGVVVRPEFFEQSAWGTRSSQARSDVMQLRGRRFAYAEEANKAIKLDAALLKTLTGKGKISSRDMYTKEQQFEKTVIPWLVTNHMPRIEGHDEAMWRRAKIVKFRNRFRDEPSEGEKHRDKNLKDKVVSEVDFWTTWIIKGALDWKKHGLVETESVRQATSAERTEQDELRQWFEDACEVSPDATELLSEVNSGLDWWWVSKRGEHQAGQKRSSSMARRSGLSEKEERQLEVDRIQTHPGRGLLSE